MALHRTIEEIRSLPYPEYRSWELFYLLEPWGWQNEEYHAAALMTLLYNVNAGKGKGKKVEDFMRDLGKTLLEELEPAPNISEMPREKVLALIKRDFGL